MPYVQRDGGNNITGAFHVKQPGKAEELLPENDAEVVAFRNRTPSKADASLSTEELADHLVIKGIITTGEITTIKNNR